MALKDKLVTLEDLKAAYDNLKGKIDMWDDITNTLTFSNASWIVSGYSGSDRKTIIKKTDASVIARIKVAKVSVTAGEKYRITGWAGLTPNNALNGTSTNVSTIPAVLTDASDNILMARLGKSGYCEGTSNTGARVGTFGDSGWGYVETEVRIPKNVSYLYIFDFSVEAGSTAGDIIVEKAA